MKRQPMSKGQQAVWKWVHTYIRRHGFPPALEEIRLAFQWSSRNAVAQHLSGLRKKGYVDWHTGRARTLHLLTPTQWEKKCRSGQTPKRGKRR